MKKLSALLLAVLSAGAFGQVTCQNVGQFTYCSDGTSYNHIGNFTYGSDGTTAQRIGNQTYINPPPQPVPQVQPFQFQPPVQANPPAWGGQAPVRQCGYNVYGQYVCR